MVARRTAVARSLAVITSYSSHSVQKSCCVMAASSSTIRSRADSRSGRRREEVSQSAAPLGDARHVHAPRPAVDEDYRLQPLSQAEGRAQGVNQFDDAQAILLARQP